MEREWCTSKTGIHRISVPVLHVSCNERMDNDFNYYLLQLQRNNFQLSGRMLTVMLEKNPERKSHEKKPIFT